MELSSLNHEIYTFCIQSIYPPKREWKVDHFEYTELPGSYDTNNGVLAFIDENNERWETPFTSRVVEALKQAGYTCQSISVPLSNPIFDKDIPAPTYVDKWEGLSARADIEERTLAAQKDQMTILEVAANKSISGINPEVERTTVALPLAGVATSQNGTAPVEVQKPIPVYELTKFMGTYNENNGHTVFIDVNGQTRVAETTDELMKELANAGYTPASLGVPIDDFVTFVTEATAETYISAEVIAATLKFQQEWAVAKNIVNEKKALANNWSSQESGVSR